MAILRFIWNRNVHFVVTKSPSGLKDMILTYINFHVKASIYIQQLGAI
jgi:hypothetical protein